MPIKKIILALIIITGTPSRPVDPNDKTAINKSLMDAVMENQTEKVQKILLNGADPNATNNGKTALMYATELINSDMVQNLLDAGADVTTRWGTQNALDMARRTSHSDITKILDKAYAKFVKNQQRSVTVNVNTNNDKAALNVKRATLNKSLIEAVIANQTEEVQKLLKMGADPSTMKDGQTMLMHAVKHPNPTMVQDLIGAGASITPRYKNKNALEMAEQLPNRNIMDTLSRTLTRELD